MKKKYIKIISFMLITILILSLILFIKSINLRKSNYYYSYSYNNDENTIEFYKTTNKKKKINTYNCFNDDCVIYSKGSNYYFSDKDNKTIINDGNKIFIYDFINSKKLSNDFDDLIKIENNKETKSYIVKYNNLFGIIDLNGNELIPITYEELGKIKDEKLINYNYKENYIIARSNNKYGIINLTENNVIIDFKYEKIEIKNENIIGYINGTLETININ